MPEQLGLGDAMWLYLGESDQSMHMTYVAVYRRDPGRAAPTREALEERVGERMLTMDRLRRRLQTLPVPLDYPYWVPASPDPSSHVDACRVSGAGSWQDLFDSVIDVHAEPLRLDRPPWHVTLLQGIDGAHGLPRGSFAIVTRLHHALVDGTSALTVIGALSDATPDAPRARSGRPVSDRRGSVSPPSVLWRAGRNTVERPLRAALTAAAGLPTFARAAAGWARKPALPPDGAPRSPLNDPPSGRQHLAHVSFDVKELKTRARHDHATINDLLLAVIGGALREVHAERDALPARSLVCACPVLMPRSGETELGNNAGFMLVPLATDVADAHARLAAVARASKAAKRSAVAPLPMMLAGIAGELPAAPAATLIRAGLEAARHRPAMNTVLSNVPGPVEPQFLDGHTLHMSGAAVTMPRGIGAGLLHLLTSTAGRAFLSIVSDPAVLPEPAHYTQLLVAAAAELDVKAHPSA